MPKYGKALHLVPADLSAPNLRHQTPAPALQQLAQRPGMHRGDLQSSQPWVHTLPSPRLWQSHLAAVPVPFQVLVPARGAQGCCDPALQPPWAVAWGCSQHSLQRVLQMDCTAVGMWEAAAASYLSAGRAEQGSPLLQGPRSSCLAQHSAGFLTGMLLCSVRGCRAVRACPSF